MAIGGGGTLEEVIGDAIVMQKVILRREFGLTNVRLAVKS
jgi:hypothetical protein